MTVAVPARLEPVLDNPDIRSSRHRRQLSRAEAEELTAAIRSHANRLWMLVAIAHERKAWRALGYDSWKDYVTTELLISESRSYQLVDTGRVMLTIADAAGVPPDEISPISARTVKAVKDRLPELRRAIRSAVNGAVDAPELVDLDELVGDVVAEVRDAADTGTRGGHRSPWVECPVCTGKGHLGRGEQAKELAQRAARWVARTTG